MKETVVFITCGGDNGFIVANSAGRSGNDIDSGNSGRLAAAILARVSQSFRWDAKMVFLAEGDLDAPC